MTAAATRWTRAVEKGSTGPMKKVTLIIILIVAVLGIIVVLQNTQAVDTRILFITVTMPRAVLLFVATMFGFAVGVLVSIALLRKSKSGKKAETGKAGT
jgi:uncharacterized integral membrane protein